MKLSVALFFSSLALAQQSSTTAPCSPIAPNNTGTITIHCPDSESKRDILALLQRNQGNAKVTLAKLDQCVQGVENIAVEFEVLRQQIASLGDSASPKTLLAKYPLGYVIFDVAYTNTVFPYQSGGLQEYKLDWSVVRITENTPTRISLQLPNLSTKDGKPLINDASTGGIKRVGNLGGYIANDISVWGEILAIRDSGIVFLVGFQAFHFPSPTPPAKPN
jgi:hypothetical protein